MSDGFFKATLKRPFHYGIQAFNPKVQEIVNRVDPEKMLFELMGWMKEAEFESLKKVALGIQQKYNSRNGSTVVESPCELLTRGKAPMIAR